MEAKPPGSKSTLPAAANDVVAKGASFPIVGIGASAGGLEALRRLLGAMPTDTGMGFVIVQHLAPEHASSLSQILARTTTMPVGEVSDEPNVEPNHVYVIPPGRDMIISAGKLRLLLQERHGRPHGIDQFFRSLAEDSGHQAIGVVLSGSATDGTLGLEAIKTGGGVTFAQDDSAQHDSMPRSAVAAGCVDFELSPEGIAREIARIAHHPYVAEAVVEEGKEEKQGHSGISEIVRRVTGVDFTHYKANTLHRRIQRRMMVHRVESIAEYEALLRASPGEVETLYQDLLINVTSFFRNPESFELLAEKIFPALIAGRTRHEPVRIWTLGCSTGEEAYSLAMVFTEFAEMAKSTVQLQMFASDLNAISIEQARIGRYPRSISQEVSPERLRRFFVEEDGQYRVSKSIRERVVFSRHNVLTDPPFSRLDLVSCRNVLIYFEPVLQQQIVPLLHYALKPGGRLWLGSSESLGTSRALFEVEDPHHKIFVRRPGPTPAGPRFQSARAATLFPPPARGAQETLGTQLHRDAERALLARYVPPGVVVTPGLEIVQFRGETGAYLAPAAGMASHDLLKMLREGLLVPVRTALARAKNEGRPAREEGARVRSNGGFLLLAIEVIPITASPTGEAGFVILFDEGAAPPRLEAPRWPERHGESKPELGNESELTRISQELAATREYLQSVIEQQDAANEELQSANEEAQSANEELQSANEELETSKEEIQSSNEELATVNDELNHRNHELSRLNDDLTNVLGSTQLSILILSRELRLRRFTPVAEKALNLVAGDVGRPIGDIKLSVTIPDLPPLLNEVIDNVSPREQEVQDSQGRWFSLRARPYLTHDKKVDGAVVTLVDVDALRRERDYAQEILAGVRIPLVVLDGSLNVKMASRAFYEHFRVPPGETLGRRFYAVGKRQWDFPALRTLFEDVLPREQAVENYEVRHHFDPIGPRIVLVTARRLAQTPGAQPLIILSLDDATEREVAAKELRESEERYRSIIDSSPDCIAVLDLEGNLVSLDAGRALLGIAEDTEILGKPWLELWQRAEGRAAAGTAIAAARAGGQGHFDGHCRTQNGLDKWWDIAVTPLRDAFGQTVRLLAISRDVTQRHQMEQALAARADELAQADRRKDEFLAMLAHELRNPLAPLRNAAEILQATGITHDEGVQAQEIIGRQIQNMSRMIEDLLDVSRINEGKIELRKEAVSLKTILNSAVCLVQSACASKGQEVSLSLIGEPVTLNADPTRLEQVFGNLLNNAAKHSGEKTHITLSAERVGGEVVVRVADDGVGIDPVLLPRIFDLFVQSSRPLDRPQGGLGIGLTVAQRLVKMHGGSIEARSDGPGRGSEFIVRLPLEPSPPLLTPSQSQPVVLETTHRILIVDDNVDAARSLTTLHQRQGHNARTAFTSPDALSIAADFNPDVVLLDIGLPGMDGYEVARRLRTMPFLAGSLLIAMSGYGREEDRAKAMAAGFDEYLVKPLDLSRLQRLLQEFRPRQRE